jgi:membrane protease YdiL (CAAX protease family)
MLPLQLAGLCSVALLGALALAGRLRFLGELGAPARRVAGTLLLLGVLSTCVFFPAISGDAAEIDVEHISFPSLFLGHWVLTGFLLAWWAMLSPRVPLSRFLLLERPRLDDVQRGLWIGGLGWALTITATSVIAAALTLAGQAPESGAIPDLMPWLAALPLAQKLVVIAIAMTVEEAFFRAFLQTRIGWIPSSLLFALSHASYGLPLMMVSVLIISLLIGWTLRRAGRLLPCIVAHGVFDAIQLLVVIPLAMRMIER